METSDSLAPWLATARALHICACVLLLGVDAFAVMIASEATHVAPELALRWRNFMRRVKMIWLPIAIVSGLGWFLIVAIDMSGLNVREALTWEVIKQVGTQTNFGRLCQIRGMLLLAGVAEALLLRKASASLSIHAILVGSMAWAGHGLTGRWREMHLVSDVAHLLITALWPVGLWPLYVLLSHIRRLPAPSNWLVTSPLVSRFSTMSLLAVVGLFMTGLVNTLSLAGSIGDLISLAWGRLLLIKVGLFGAMIVVGATNMLRHKPGILQQKEKHLRALRRNVMIEVIVGAIILIIVAILGLLPARSV